MLNLWRSEEELCRPKERRASAFEGAHGHFLDVTWQLFVTLQAQLAGVCVAQAQLNSH
jgi:hypothetical protein